MGLKDENAQLRKELADAHKRLDAWQRRWDTLHAWAADKCYQTKGGLSRFASYEASRKQGAAEAVRGKILETEGHGE